MTPDQFKRVESVFHKARQFPLTKREEFLADACADDLTIRREVNALFESMDPAQRLTKLQNEVGGILAPILGTMTDLQPADAIGPYRIMRLLGEGGMGSVYLAEQTEPLHREVALKVIKLGMDTKQTLARFENEREALALMNHANVARVFDAGVTPQGRPYFAMEYVEGEPITEFCDRHQLSIEDRLRLFMDVCRAVQHAHQKGIIHRDLKPSNVLISTEATSPILEKGALGKGRLGGVTVKVIDFGVAKATQHRASDRTVFTEQGQFIGTPGYMSPEQAEMASADIDTRTDIYSLGVLLYELLVGARPFDDDVLRSAGFAEFQRIIREVDPPKPSTRLSALQSIPAKSEPFAQAKGVSEPRAQATGRSEPCPSGSGDPASVAHETPLPHGRGSDISTIAKRRGTHPRTLFRQLRGDLDWIIMKCLEKDRARRYETANALAMDIERHLRGEPVLAGPPSGVYRFKKFARRNKGAMAAAVMLMLTLTSGTVISTLLYFRAESQRKRAVEAEKDQSYQREQAEAARDDSDAVTTFLSDMFAAADPDMQGKDVTVREVLDRESGKISEQFAEKPLIEARLRETIGITYVGLGLYDQAEIHLTDASAIYDRVLGEQDRRTFSSKNALAGTLVRRGQLNAAENAYRGILETLRRSRGDEHPYTLVTMANLASVLLRRGRLAESEAMTRKTLETQRRVLGEQHPHTLGSMSDLASALRAQGRYAEAEKLYRTTMESQRRVMGDEHPATLNTMNSIANAVFDQGRFAEAEQLHRETLELRRRVLGEDHPDVHDSLNGLANALFHQGRVAEAEALYRTSVEIRIRLLGAEHPESLTSMSNLGNSLYEQSRFTEAEEIFGKTLATRQRVLGEEHPDTLASMNNMAITLQSKGRHADAENLYNKMLVIQHRVLGTEHPLTLMAMVNLANALTSQGRHMEAEEIYRSSLVAFHRVFGPEHIYTLRGMSGLADVLSRLRRYEEAERLLRETLEIQRRLVGEEHLDTLASMHNLANTLLDQGRFAESEKLLRGALEISRRVLGEKHLQTIASTILLGNALSSQTRYIAAEELLRATQGIVEDALGENHPYVPANMSYLAIILIDQNRFDEAEPLARDALTRCEAHLPDDKLRFEAGGALGAALIGLGRFIEGEPLLARAYQELSVRNDVTITSQRELLNRIVRLYESWNLAEPNKGHDQKAAEWRAKLDEFQSATPETSAQP